MLTCCLVTSLTTIAILYLTTLRRRIQQNAIDLHGVDGSRSASQQIRLTYQVSRSDRAFSCEDTCLFRERSRSRRLELTLLLLVDPSMDDWCLRTTRCHLCLDCQLRCSHSRVSPIRRYFSNPRSRTVVELRRLRFPDLYLALLASDRCDIIRWR